MDRWSSYPQGKPPARGPSPFLWLSICVFVGVSAAWIYRLLDAPPLHDGGARPLPVVARGELAPDEQATIELFRRNSAAVVHIRTSGLQRGFFYDAVKTERGTGTGFLWDERGYVVTNYHVIKDGTEWDVTLSDGATSLPARLVGFWEFDDLAVLKVDLPREASFSTIALGSSSDLQVGQKVFAIGNPFGLDQTLTTGIISGLGRTISSVAQTPIKDVIQTDAAINPGNSGGPLLDSAGRLIGVNTAIYSPSGASAGIGFAVPVDRVNVIVPQLIAKGKVARPDLGLSWLRQDFNRRFYPNGVGFYEVAPGSPGAEAGLVPLRRGRRGYVLGDTILAIDGVRVHSETEVLGQLVQKEVGQEVTLHVRRASGDLETIRIALAEAR